MEILIDLINKYNNIYIFMHQHPDADAFSSAYSFKEVIELNFDSKNVFVVESDNKKILTDSLGLIVDCSTADRVLNQNYVNCKESILIDHHLKDRQYTNYEIVNVEAAATCELLFDIINLLDLNIDSSVANHLYKGILADTLNFTTKSTTANTLKVASGLLNYDVNIAKIVEELFSFNREDFLLINHLRSKCEFDSNVITVFVTIKEVNYFNSTMTKAKEAVKEFTSIKEYPIVVLFYENENGLYNASIRSKKLPINLVANKYGGGGHALASGVKDLTTEQCQLLISDLKEVK